ncbi:Pkinase-domain-containing protein [Wallemia mellicola]|uniref:Pkinase-domain-containing protein n=1 Tax=Wallemia mellicola TaxID=1708541 RepID=A0A4T0NSI7_9BASI|nr:Pkinase-domain-containing protein [Wallemia mellicola]
MTTQWPANGKLEIGKEGVDLYNFTTKPNNLTEKNVKVTREDDKLRLDQTDDSGQTYSYTGRKQDENEYNYVMIYDTDSKKLSIEPINGQYSLQQLEDVDEFLDKELLDGFQDISDDDQEVESNTLPEGAASNQNTQPMSLNAFLGNDNIQPTVSKSTSKGVINEIHSVMPKTSLSLGQGFMSWKPPSYIRSALNNSINEDTSVHHYSHPKGRPRLRNALSEHFSPEFTCLNGRKLDTESEIIVTAGANEGIYSILAAFLEQDDEVILFEPAFDQYMPNVRYNGGKEVYVPIRFHGDPTKNSTGDDWKIDINELRAAITPKTKAMIFNTPHNPIGKVFNEQELNEIAQVAIDNNLLVISDEVYDCLTFDGSKHLKIANIPGMWERTLTVGSAGKSFAATGWRVGWVLGHPELIKATLAATVRIVFCVNSTAQEGAAIGLEQSKEQNFFHNQREEYEVRRDTLTKHLDSIGLPYTKPSGSYFILADISKVDFPEDYPFPDYIKSRTRDFRFAWWLAHEFGVVTIPPSDFYGEENQKLGYNNKKAQLAQAYQSLTTDLTSPVLRTIGNYTLGRTLGSGSYGIVRLSTHRLVKGARVAVKSVSKTHNQLSALVRELHHYRRLSHPHIAQLLEIVATEKDIHLVTELCDGGELFDYLVDKGRLSDTETRRVFGQLMLALHYLHSNGVVHRDLKLENILLDKDGNVKLGDFGFAREFDDGPGNLMSTWCGTTAYASPEMLRGEKYSGKETDIWSAGIILYALLTGGLPFDDDDEDVMKELVLKGEYYNPSDFLSPDACDLISSILQQKPSDRLTIEQILAHPFFTRFPSQQFPLTTLHEKLEEHNNSYDEKQVADALEEEEFEQDLDPNDEPPRRLVPASKSVESLLSIKRRSNGSFKQRSSMNRTFSNEKESGASTPPIQRTPSRTKRRSVSSTMTELPNLTPVASRIPSTTSLRDHFKAGLASASTEELDMYPQEPNYLELCKAVLAQPFEEEWERVLLQSLSEIGFDTGQIKHSVINHACDAAGGLWWLIRKQNIERREQLSRIEEEGALERRDSEAEYLMMKDTRKQKENVRMNEQRADFSKKSLLDLSESSHTGQSSSNTAPTVQVEASTSSLQLPNTSAPSSPSKTKSRSSSISMLQRATTALSGGVLPRKKSEDHSLNDETVTPPPNHQSLTADPRTSSSSLNQSSPVKTLNESKNESKDSFVSSPNKSASKDNNKKNLFNTFRTWFTDDKREKRKSKTTKQHPKGASSLSDASYVQVRRHIRAPSSPLPLTSKKHSRSISATSSMEEDKQVLGLGLKDSDTIVPQKTYFLASKRTAAFAPPPPINVKSPVMKSFGNLKASKFDYSKASPTKISTNFNPTESTLEDALEWVDEDDFAGGIGQGEASAFIGEFEAGIQEDDDFLTEHSDNDNEIEGVKKLRKKSKGKRKNYDKSDNNTETLSEFKFPSSTPPTSAQGPNQSNTNHQKWRPSVTTAAVIEEDEEDA